jgi:DNA-binding NarL/FixJ family response regulator
VAEQPFSLWLVDDERKIAEVLQAVAENDKNIRHWQSYDHCAAAVAALKKEELPDIILLDVHFPDHDGMDFIPDFLRTAPHLPILVTTVETQSEFVYRAFRLGAKGYLVKPYGYHEMIAACRRVLRGEMPIDSRVTHHLVNQFSVDEEALRRYGLTETERQMLPLVALGLTVEVVAERLFVSPHTVKAHLRNIHSKLGTRSHTELIAKLYRERLV